MPRIPLSLALLGLLASPALASSVIAESIEELSAKAPLVVRGTVRQSQTGWDEGQRHIWTWTEISVTEPLKGGAVKIVLVKQPGGEVGPVGQAVSGAARFEPGEDVVLFLEPATDEREVYLVRGLSAGKVRLTTVQGQPQAVRSLDGLELTHPGRFQVLPAAKETGLGTTQTFLNRVRLAVKGAGQ